MPVEMQENRNEARSIDNEGIKIDVRPEKTDRDIADIGDEDIDLDSKPGFFQSDFFLSIITTVNVVIAVYSAVMASLLAPQLCCPDVSVR
jgi:hypothetical protein